VLRLGMEKRTRTPKSVRIFIRSEKARIRRQFSDAKTQEEMINKLYEDTRHI
jgi:hypothetical protein